MVGEVQTTPTNSPRIFLMPARFIVALFYPDPTALKDRFRAESDRFKCQKRNREYLNLAFERNFDIILSYDAGHDRSLWFIVVAFQIRFQV